MKLFKRNTETQTDERPEEEERLENAFHEVETDKSEAPIDNTFVHTPPGAVISDEEQMQVRERMERELAEQRKKLHEN